MLIFDFHGLILLDKTYLPFMFDLRTEHYLKLSSGQRTANPLFIDVFE